MSPATVIAGDIRWTLSTLGQELLSPEQFDIELLRGSATVIKHGSHRTVYRVPLARTTIYWKHCRLNGSRAWWREVLRGPKAQLEYRRLRELEVRGVASIEPLAWGRSVGRWPRGSYLLTRELLDALPLDEFWNTAIHPAVAVQHDFTHAFARWVAQVHEAGVLHPDFHPGNILVRATQNSWQFFLIDVHDVELYPRLSSRQREDNLMLLNRWFLMRTARSQRLRFIKEYQQRAKTPTNAVNIEERTDRSNVRLWLARDQRCTGTNRHFEKVSAGSQRGHALSPVQSDVRRLVEQPNAPFDSDTAAILKNSRTSTVVEWHSDEPKTYIYKRLRIKQWYGPLVNMVRPSPTLRSWRMGHAFAARGLPTPVPILMFHRHSWLPHEGYLLCPKLENTQHLHEYLHSLDVDRKRILIDVVARHVRLMHERCVSHRDLKPANILVDAHGHCHFIDLVGVRTLRHVKRSRRVKDIVRLNVGFLNDPLVTRTDRLRFLRMYLLWALHGKADWKSWWKELAQRTEAKVLQNHRRGRPLN